MVTIIKIKIYYYEVFGNGNLEFTFDKDINVDDVFKEINRIYGKKFERLYGKTFLKAVYDDFNIFLNNNHISGFSGSKRILKNGDSLLILRPVSGG